MAKNQSLAEDISTLRIAFRESIVLDTKYLFDDEVKKLYEEYLEHLQYAAEIKSQILGLQDVRREPARYYVKCREWESGPFTDKVNIDKWALAHLVAGNLKVGDKITVTCYPYSGKDISYTYGEATVTYELLEWSYRK